MLNPLADKLICVRGNCEAEVDQMVLNFPVMSESAVICDHGKTLFATHGHIYGPDKLPPLADGTFFLYGHTHIPDDQIKQQGKKSIRCINPGSVSIPKNGSAHRCLIWAGEDFEEAVL